MIRMPILAGYGPLGVHADENIKRFNRLFFNNTKTEQLSKPLFHCNEKVKFIELKVEL